MVSLASLNAASACEVPFEFEYELPDGSPSGVFFSVLGSESPTVMAETERLIDERRRWEAQQELRQRLGGRKAEAAFIPFARDVEFGRKLTAVRLVGWRGIDEPFTPEAARELVRSNAHIADAIATASNELGNFMKAPQRS